MQEDRNLIYLKDTYSTRIAPVALSSEEGMTDPRLYSTAGLPDGHGEELLAPRVVPAVFGTTVRTTVGVDRGMLVFATNGYDSIYKTVPQMELLTLEGASGVHPDIMVVRLDETAAVPDRPLRSLLLLGQIRIHLISWILGDLTPSGAEASTLPPGFRFCE